MYTTHMNICTHDIDSTATQLFKELINVINYTHAHAHTHVYAHTECTVL